MLLVSPHHPTVGAAASKHCYQCFEMYDNRDFCIVSFPLVLLDIAAAVFSC